MLELSREPVYSKKTSNADRTVNLTMSAGKIGSSVAKSQGVEKG